MGSLASAMLIVFSVCLFLSLILFGRHIALKLHYYALSIKRLLQILLKPKVEVEEGAHLAVDPLRFFLLFPDEALWLVLW